MNSSADGREDAAPLQRADQAALTSGPLAQWFRRRFGAATEVQRLAWPEVVRGGHVLVSAPTGTGKTLAVFLPILAELWPRAAQEPACSGSISCLYVAPLKALGHDTARTLTTHLQELAERPGDCPRLAVRSGDTSAAERRRLQREPPHLLLTTPESLAVLLSQPAVNPLFAGLRWVVVDEVHALAGCKRGADLALSLERLTRLAGPRLQRLGLSATAAPLPEAARWLAGVGRPCAVVQASRETPLELALAPLPHAGRYLAALVDRLLPELQGRRTTLVFTNTRRLAEQLAWALRRNLPGWEPAIAVHHSSLAAGRRRQVEEDMKAGRLRVVVSSTSLELGIDVGPIDLAVLVHPPGDVVRLLQRVGRSGHSPQRVKCGLVLTDSAAQLLEAAVTAASASASQCEPLHLPAAPLDVLCQQLVGMVAAGMSDPEEMFALARQAAPFERLDRRDFDGCLTYLCGRDQHGDPWLPARLRHGPEGLTLAGPRTASLLRQNLGTILTEPQWDVHLLDAADPEGASVLGQVDQAFAERLHPGDRFLLDGRCLQVRRIAEEDNAVCVEETTGLPRVPSWAGSPWPLSRQLARRLYTLRTQAAEALPDGPQALAELLRRDYQLEGEAAQVLVEYFQRQEVVSEVPDGHSLLIEGISHEAGDDFYLHTPLNRLGNDALARVAVLRLARDHGRSALSTVADLGLALRVRGHINDPPALLRTLLAPERFDDDLDAALEDSPALRGRFAQVARTGLMLLSRTWGRRRVGGPEWGERRLFEQVRVHDADFVLLRQALREVRGELCDAAAARDFLGDLAGRPFRCRWLAGPSPFVGGWTQSGPGAAESVETPAEVLARLQATLLGQEGGDAGPH
jgi:ATP-dependent Lhr-like helicase